MLDLCRLLLITGPSAAFKKWSGHVVQKGSRKGMFGYLPREKIWIHNVSRYDVITPWQGSWLTKNVNFTSKFRKRKENFAAFHTLELAVKGVDPLVA